MMGRWRSGAPLALAHPRRSRARCRRRRNNDFVYGDDAIGYKTPPGSHVRRANPRDASVAGVVRLHRMIRRGTAYGPELPEGVARRRRRRSRADVRVRRRAPRAAVRVRPVRVDRTAANSSGSATSRIPSSAAATATARSRFRGDRFRGASTGCRASSSHAAASTASCQGCARCAGSRSSMSK